MFYKRILVEIKCLVNYAVINYGEYFDKAELDVLLKNAKDRKVQFDSERN